MPKHDEYHPGPLQGISPEGLPGLFTVAFVLFGFTTLFVSRGIAEILLWVMVGVLLSVSGVTMFRSVRSLPTSPSEPFRWSLIGGFLLTFVMALIIFGLSLFAGLVGLVAVAGVGALATWHWQRRRN
jgi:hypothetical protein